MLHSGYGRTCYIWVMEGHVTFTLWKDMLHLRGWFNKLICLSPMILCNLSFHVFMEGQKCYTLTGQISFETKCADCPWSWSITQVSKEAWETKVYNLNIYFCQPPYNHQTHKNWSKIWEFTTKLNLSSIFISIGSRWGMWVNVVIRWMINNLLVLLRKSVTPTIFQIKI